MSTHPTPPLTDRIVASLPARQRLEVLDTLAARHSEGHVSVEWSPFRKLEDAYRVTGRILGVAVVQGGGSTHALVIQPLDPGLRTVVIPAARVLRVRVAGAMPRPGAAVLLRVLAGPPVD